MTARTAKPRRQAGTVSQAAGIAVCLTVLLPAGVARADMADLLGDKDLYGWGILANADVAAAARKLAGDDYGTFEGILNVSPPAAIIESRYVYGQGCRPHQCDETGALIVVDTADAKVFMAMTDGAVKKSWPGAITAWPAKIRAIVKQNYR